MPDDLSSVQIYDFRRGYRSKTEHVVTATVCIEFTTDAEGSTPQQVRAVVAAPLDGTATIQDAERALLNAAHVLLTRAAAFPLGDLQVALDAGLHPPVLVLPPDDS